jgi:hypothetical protein
MREATREFLRNPPPGSKTRAAMDFGIDLTLTTRNMFALTPGERLERMQRDQIDVRSSRTVDATSSNG